MKIVKCTLNTICLLIFICIPNILLADVLYNGDGFVKGKLKALTHEASTNTLHATVNTFTMIAYIEEGKISQVPKVGDSVVTKLTDAIQLLKDARSLPDSEFKEMDKWLTKLNYDQHAARFKIYSGSRIWQEVVDASRMGGREWIGQCLHLNTSLEEEIKNFLRIPPEKLQPENTWHLIRVWQRELYRGVYLSIVLTR